MKIKYLLILIVALCAINAGATIRYVKPTASGSGNGSSWANASSDLQAIINSSSTGDEVWVAAGTYLPTRDPFGNASPTNPRDKTFRLKGGVDVYGGFAGNETSITARNISANITILSGDIGTAINSSDNCYHVVLMVISGSSPGCILDGFKIKDGNANSWPNITVNSISILRGNGGGIYAYGGTGSVFRNLHIYNNYATDNGGGIYVEAGKYTIKFDSIYNNYSPWHGGGMFINGNSLLDSNTLYSNNAGRDGGGAYIASQTVLNGNAIYNNYAGDYQGSRGGGVYFNAPDSSKITNNTIFNNSSRHSGAVGGGLYLTGDTTTAYHISNNQMFLNTAHAAGGAVYLYKARYCNFINNTFYGNVLSLLLSSTPRGGAIYNNNVPSHYINNIFWKNIRVFGWTNEDDVNSYIFDTSYIKNNIFQLASNLPGNMFGVNPLFVNESKTLGNDSIPGTADDGLMLKVCSPAVNAGMSSVLSSRDILGSSRIGNYDIGAFEYPNVGPVIASPISGENVICLNSNSTYTNTASGGVWSSSDTSVAIISQAGVVAAKGIGSATITYKTDTTGCGGTIVNKTIAVTVYTPLNPIAGPDSVCKASSIQLSNSVQGGVWTSSDTTVAIVNNVGLVTGIDTGIATITYKVGGIGCSTQVAKTITVGAVPIVSPITGDYYACLQDTIQYSNVTPGGVWTTASNGIRSSISSSGWLIPTNPGSDAVIYTVTNTFGCVKSVAKSISIPNPPRKYDIVGTDTICEGDTSLQYYFVLYGTWSSADTNIATVTPIGGSGCILKGTGAGKVTISYTQSDICKTVITKEITVLPKPKAGMITGKDTLCMNNTMQLSDTVQGGIWSMSSNGIISTIDTTGLVAPVNPGTDTAIYIVTNIFGCTDTTTFPITVFATPVVDSIHGTDSLCRYQNTTFTDSTTGGFWQSDDTAVAIIDSNGLITAVDSGLATIRYSVINAAGCTTTVSKDIFIKAVTVPGLITGSSTICINNSEQFRNAVPGGVWSAASSGNICNITPSGLLSANNAGKDTIVYTITNSSGCSSAESLVVTVNAPLHIPVTGIDSVCAGAVAQFTHIVPSGNWANFNMPLGSINDAGIYTSHKAGTDTIYYQYTSNGCPVEVKKPFSIHPLPDPAAIVGDNMLCKAKKLPLNPSVSGGIWSSNNNSIARVDGNGIVYGIDTGDAMIKYTLTNHHGCVNSSVLPMTVNEVIVDANKNYTTMTATGNHAEATYQWVNCDTYQPISGADSAQFVAFANGRYAVVASYKGCADTSQCLDISILGNGYPIISPNPTSDMVSINTGPNIADFIRIFDMLGRVVIEVVPEKSITTIELGMLATGAYPVHIKFGGEIVTHKLIVW